MSQGALSPKQGRWVLSGHPQVALQGEEEQLALAADSELGRDSPLQRQALQHGGVRRCLQSQRKGFRRQQICTSKASGSHNLCSPFAGRQITFEGEMLPLPEPLSMLLRSIIELRGSQVLCPVG